MTEPNNTIEALRAALFDTIRDLRDPNNPMELARAGKIAEVGQVIINSVKSETDFLKLARAEKADGPLLGTGFIPTAPRAAIAHSVIDGSKGDAADTGAASGDAEPAV